LIICSIVWLAFGGAAYLIYESERQISGRRTTVHAFDVRAREAIDALASVRAAQQAYAAQGQGVAFWTEKVSALIETATRAVDALRAAAASSNALAALVETSAAIADFTAVDLRAREYLDSAQPLMAADIAFAEGSEAAALALRRVERAAMEEHQSLDAFEAGVRKVEIYALAGAGGLGAIALALLALAPRRGAGGPETSRDEPVGVGSLSADPLGLRSTSEPPRADAAALKSAARLCTEFARVHDVGDVNRLLAEAADLMDSSGLIVWLADPPGGSLRAVMAHGYPQQALARMPVVPRGADNAAAAACRSSSLQIVLARPGASNGALVAPLLSSHGCIGAFAAEIKGGGETADATQSIATIVAAQLATVLSPAATEPGALQAPEPRSAVL
jgi:hypothetical protein